MDEPPLGMWERAGALATYESLIRDLSHIDHHEVWRRINRLSAAQQTLVFGWISQTATGSLDESP